MAQIQGLTLLFGTLLQADGGITGNLSKTLEALTVASDATVSTVPVTGDLSVTLGALTVAADATITNPAVTADLAVTLGAASLSSDASVIAPITADLTATLGALTLSADATITQILVDDTHDGDYLKKKLKAERKALKRRRQQVQDLYEQLVEGKEPLVEVAAIIEQASITPSVISRRSTATEYDRMIAALERAVELNARLQAEADDEEVLLLI